MRTALTKKLLLGSIEFGSNTPVKDPYQILDSLNLTDIDTFVKRVSNFYYEYFNISYDFTGRFFDENGDLFCELIFDASNELFSEYSHGPTCLEDLIISFKEENKKELDLEYFDLMFSFENDRFKSFTLSGENPLINSDVNKLLLDYLSNFFMEFKNNSEFDYCSFKIDFNGVDLSTSIHHRESHLVSGLEELMIKAPGKFYN